MFWAVNTSSSFSISPFTSGCKCSDKGEARHPVTFVKRHEYMDMSPAGDDLWMGLISSNGGFAHDKTGAKFGISMFHNLHCLSIIRHELQKLQNQTQGLHVHEQMKGHKPNPNIQQGEAHWTHCLDMLVQAIECAADDTLEPEVHHKVIDGYNVVHQCRDKKKLWQWAEAPYIQVDQ